MRAVLVLVLAGVCAGCSKGPSVSDVKKTVEDMRSGNTEPAKYVSGLRDDAAKAQEAADRANRAVGATQPAVDDAVKEGGE